jgi:hypothetical protein
VHQRMLSRTMIPYPCADRLRRRGLDEQKPPDRKAPSDFHALSVCSEFRDLRHGVRVVPGRGVVMGGGLNGGMRGGLGQAVEVLLEVV